MSNLKKRNRFIREVCKFSKTELPESRDEAKRQRKTDASPNKNTKEYKRIREPLDWHLVSHDEIFFISPVLPMK